MLSETNKKILLAQIHKDIQELSRQYTQSIKNGKFNNLIAYPPGSFLNEAEKKALGALTNNGPSMQGLYKIIRDAMSAIIFNVLNYIDWTGDPGDPKWTGILLIDRTAENAFDSRLHDEFFETAPEESPVVIPKIATSLTPGLNEGQINAVIVLLESFGSDKQTIEDIADLLRTVKGNGEMGEMGIRSK